jgi:hypothetical protein
MFLATQRQELRDLNRSVAVKISRREPCYKKSGTGCAGQRVGGGGRS